MKAIAVNPITAVRIGGNGAVLFRILPAENFWQLFSWCRNLHPGSLQYDLHDAKRFIDWETVEKDAEGYRILQENGLEMLSWEGVEINKVSFCLGNRKQLEVRFSGYALNGTEPAESLCYPAVFEFDTESERKELKPKNIYCQIDMETCGEDEDDVSILPSRRSYFYEVTAMPGFQSVAADFILSSFDCIRVGLNHFTVKAVTPNEMPEELKDFASKNGLYLGNPQLTDIRIDSVYLERQGIDARSEEYCIILHGFKDSDGTVLEAFPVLL